VTDPTASGPPVHDATAEPARSEQARVYADVPNRLLGYLIDSVAVTVLAFVGAVVLSLLAGPVVTFDLNADPTVDVDTGLAFANAVLTTAIGAAYFVVGWSRFGGTLGLRLLRMRIAAEDGGHVTLGAATVRWAFVALPFGVNAMAAIALEGVIDVLLLVALAAWFLFLAIATARDERKQGPHDRVAHTVVTKAAQAAPALAAGGDVRVH
jgi:uncharacterized RDD family membrane protein YckC